MNIEEFIILLKPKLNEANILNADKIIDKLAEEVKNNQDEKKCVECGLDLKLNSDEIKTGLCKDHMKKFNGEKTDHEILSGNTGGHVETKLINIVPESI